MMKKCIAFLIIVFLICSYSTLVVAARLGGKWDRNPKYNINDTNLPYEYKTATSNAVSSWNSVLSKINANIRFESSTITSMDLNISADYYGDIGCVFCKYFLKKVASNFSIVLQLHFPF